MFHIGLTILNLLAVWKTVGYLTSWLGNNKNRQFSMMAYLQRFVHALHAVRYFICFFFTPGVLVRKNKIRFKVN